MSFIKTKQDIPHGWDLKFLADLASIKKGEQLNRLSMDDSGKYPALNGGIRPSGYTDKWNTEANTITISEGGNSCGFVNFNKERFWCGGHCYALLDLNENVDNGFLYQALKSKQDQLMKLRVGSGLPNIQKRSIEEFTLLFPKSRTEQKKIAEILETVDKEIKKTDEVVAATERLKTGLMQQLFTRGIGHTKFRKTKIGEVPEDWNVVAIKDASIELIDGDRGVNYPKLSEFSPGGYCLFLNNKNIKEDRFVFSDIQFVSREKDESLRKGKLRRYDVVLTTRGTVGNVAFYDDSVSFENMRINSGMLILRATGDLSPLYMYHLMKSSLLKKKYKEVVSGSAQPQLPIGSLEQVYIPIPPEDEQEQIAEISQSVDEKILVNQKLKAKLALLKKGLMRDLLSGKKRTI